MSYLMYWMDSWNKGELSTFVVPQSPDLSFSQPLQRRCITFTKGVIRDILEFEKDIKWENAVLLNKRTLAHNPQSNALKFLFTTLLLIRF